MMTERVERREGNDEQATFEWYVGGDGRVVITALDDPDQWLAAAEASKLSECR